MFGNLFKKLKSETAVTDGANYCFSPLRSVYGTYSGDAAFVKPVPIDGFTDKEVNLLKDWPVLDVTSMNGSNSSSGHLFDPEIVTRLEVTHKRLELLFRGYAGKLNDKNYDDYESHTRLMVEKCGILFQQKKFVFNNVFSQLDRATAFEEQSYHDFVNGFLKENPKGFREKFGELVTEEFKAYTAIKKMLSSKSYQKAVKYLIANHQRNIDKLHGEDRIGEILVRNFHQDEGAGPLQEEHKDELLRMENQIEKIANAYFSAWKNQLNFIYEWYPMISAATIIREAPARAVRAAPKVNAVI